MKKICYGFLTVCGLVFLFSGFAKAECTENGNRYGRPSCYHSEVSATEAYQAMIQNKAVIVDVRTLREYAAGHPERANNIPYPHIVTSNDQNASDFYWEVYNTVNGRLDTPIMTLCRTGSRSVDAANILADPTNSAGDPRRAPVLGGMPFTNVRNIWEGFVGRNLYAFISGLPDPTFPLDLNNDGFINVDAADVYAHTKDANPDKDGWRNFQQLPWTTMIIEPRAYLHDTEQYECWQIDEGCLP